MNPKISSQLNKSALAVMLAFGLSSSHLEAASMGRINVLSALGQPLRAEVELSADPQELAQMKVRLAPPSVFKQAEVPYTRVLSNLRFALDQKGDKPIVRVSSDKPVHDPFLDFLIEITWPNGSMVREYTFLLDPPDNTAKNAALAAKFPEPKEFVNPPVVTAAPPPVVKPLEEPKTQSPMFVASDLPTSAPEPIPTESPVTAPTIGPVAAESPTPSIVPTAAPTASPTSAPTATPEKKAEKPATNSKAEKPVKASKPASDGKTHTVQKGDTLGAIASEYLAADISLDQMLVSLFKANPSAFEGQNINRLKSGVILTIPEADTTAPAEEEAKKTVRAHTRDWHAYRQKLAAASEKRPAKPADEGTQTSQGSINTLKAETPTPQAANQDQLKVSRSEAAGRKPGVSEEDLIAKDRALREAESRVAQLEKNISELQKLVEMKNQSLATLQQQAGGKATAAVPAPIQPVQPIVQPIPEIAPGKDLLAKSLPPPLPADKVAAELSKEGAAVPPNAPATTETPSEQATTAPTEAPTEAPTLAPTPVPTPAPVDEEDPEPPTLIQKIMGLINAFGSNPIYYGSASALLLALLGVIGWREHKRRKESASDEQFAALDPHEEPSPAKTDADLGWQQPTAAVEEASGASSDDGDEVDIAADVDPVAEADVYIAYGREPQAEELLKDALKSFPQRTAIHSRLLDIYTRREAIPEFEETAELLYAVTNGVGEEWNKALEQAAALGITSGLFAPDAPAPSPAGEELANALDTIEAPETTPSASAENEIPEALDFEMPALEEPATEAPAVSAPSFDYASVDLNLGVEPASAATEVSDDNQTEVDIAEPAPVGEEAIAAEEEPEEVTTKLDLAQAYVEMGDTDGARELLNEVLGEGGPMQKAQAEKLLASLDK